jgi:hypothetical protein
MTCFTTVRAQESLFAQSRTGNDSGAEGTFYELGTIFRATAPGTVTHLRVYALASESGTHTARLWRNSDNTVVGGPYAWNYGGATGWVTLDIPDVPLEADTDYTVVVSTGGGGRNYPILLGDLAVAGGNGAHLTHPAGAGVFATTAGVRPTNGFNGSNYFRDVVFSVAPLEPPQDAPVRINEFLAENKGGLLDEDGESSDWVELYNPKATSVDLTGYQLTDGSATWTFPAVTIGPQSFVVVFASAKNRTAPSLHTNFKLDGAGEYLALKNAAGVVISEFAPAFPKQRNNVSYGRGLPSGNTGYFLTTTPGTFNGASFDGFVADTVFSVKRGVFTAPQSVAITCATPGAEIRYTLDGSVPTGASTLYTAPLAISDTTILRARAFRPGWVPTNTDTNTYLFPATVPAQTSASALARGWPAGPVNGQELRYGSDSSAAPLYSAAQKTAALTQVPSMSIVTEQSFLTGPDHGVYVNAEVADFEQPTSLELINPDGSAGFQIDCGLRMRGGQSRGDAFTKKSFNFFFRSAYGPSKLEFPLFGTDGASRFDTLSLRCEHGYSWADPYSLHVRLQFTNVRDVFVRRLWASAGFQSTRSRPYHLYLNGQYWGLYETQERAQEDFGATYFGGEPEGYDGYAATGLPERQSVVTAGNITAWQALWSGARAVNASPTNANYFSLLGRNADGSPNATLPVLLDPRELSAYMLLHYYTGHADSPLSVSFNYERPNNFRSLRRRGMTQPWHFFVHDSESSMLAFYWDSDRVNDNLALLTSPNRNDILYSNPEWIHEDLLANPEYRIAFADEAQRLLRNGGPFTEARALPLWNESAAAISQAVIGEAMRWAQTVQENQTAWNAEVENVRTNFFPGRSETVITQLRTRGIYPTVNPPAFSQHGGQVSAGYALTLSAPGGGSIYYTLDGSDPRAIGGAVAGTLYSAPIVISAPTRVRARFRSTGGEWSAQEDVAFTTYPAASAGTLIVSKIHYHPPEPSSAEAAAGFTADNDFEYLELQNLGGETLDLRGVQISGGISFSFASAAIASLAPGARVVVVENSGAFAMRYGNGWPVAGTYSGNLSDGGEALRVSDASDADIAFFTYDDVAPWPTLPDGGGYALVLRSPSANPALGASWRASYAPGGKPGGDDIFTLSDWRAQHFSPADLADPLKESTLWGNLADPDADGFSNQMEYALGHSPLIAEPAPSVLFSLVQSPPGGPRFLQAEFRVREGTSGITTRAEVTGDLAPASWQPLSPLSVVSQGDNTALVTVRDMVPDAQRRFLRITVTTP